MPISYSIDDRRGMIFEHWSGEVGASELRAYWNRLMSDPDVMALRRTVVDLRDATLRFSGSELETLVRTIAIPALQGRQWVTALVVGAPVQLGVSNQYRVFADIYSRDAIFTDIEAAAQWVQAQPRPL